MDHLARSQHLQLQAAAERSQSYLEKLGKGIRLLPRKAGMAWLSRMIGSARMSMNEPHPVREGGSAGRVDLSKNNPSAWGQTRKWTCGSEHMQAIGNRKRQIDVGQVGKERMSRINVTLCRTFAWH